MGPKLLEEDCLRVLEKFLSSKNFKLNSFEVLDFHTPFQGLIGEPFTLRIHYEFKNNVNFQDFFVKTLSPNPLLFALSQSILVFEKEAFYYDLLQKFEKYNIDVSFAPKGYFFRPYITVLEDLSKLNFEGTPKKSLLDLEHCQTCVDTLAKFHASGIIYERRKSEEMGRKYSLEEDFGDILEDKLSGKEESLATTWLRTSIKGLFQLIDLVPENHVSHNDFKARLQEVLTIERSSGLISSILHADLWTSNFMYLYEDNKPIGSKLLDYQMIKYGSVEADLVEFLMTNTTRAFRAHNFNSLVERYYKKLQEALNGAGFAEILPDLSVFTSSCEQFKLEGKIHAIIDHSFTFVADEIYEDVLSTEEKFRKFLFEERGEYIEQSYQKSEQFKKTLTEDVLELRDFFFPKN